MNETIASALSNEEVKDILTKFVQTNTVNPPGNEKVLAQWIADDFKKAGIGTDGAGNLADGDGLFGVFHAVDIPFDFSHPVA